MNNRNYRYDVRCVHASAKGHWGLIFQSLAPALQEAMKRPGKHCPCPVHGGKDAFRLFPNYAENGACVCNTCGGKRDGLATLCWVNHWDFKTALSKVATVLGIQPAGRKLVEPTRQPAAYGCFSNQKLPLGQIYQGKLLSIQQDSYEVCLMDEHSQERVTLHEEDLQRGMRIAKCQVGDRVRLRLETRQEVKDVVKYEDFNCRGALRRTFHRNIWSVQKLSSPEEEAKEQTEQARENRRRAEAIEKNWNLTSAFSWRNPEMKPMALYLRSRALLVRNPELISDVHFYGNEYYDNSQCFPAMIAAVRNLNGELVTLHKTYLSPDGHKADVSAPKRLSRLPDDRTINGCAIQLGKPDQVLAVAEGLETALSVAIATGFPCWSCLNAHGLQTVEIPACVRTVFIFADKDRSQTGQNAAKTLQNRLAQQGVLACIVSVEDEIPESAKGIDWNDILRDKGPTAFPVMRPVH